MLDGDDQKVAAASAAASAAARWVDLRRGMEQPAAADEGPTRLPRGGAPGRNPASASPVGEARQRAGEAYVVARSEHSAFLLLTAVVGPMVKWDLV